MFIFGYVAMQTAPVHATVACTVALIELWSACYGREEDAASSRVEECTELFLIPLNVMDTRGEEGKPPGAHKLQLLFLRSMLKEDVGEAGAEKGQDNIEQDILVKRARYLVWHSEAVLSVL